MRKISLPKTIKTGYRVFLINDYRDRKGYDNDGSDIYGNMDDDKNLINIFRHNDSLMLLNTLIHETLHAGTHSSGIKEFMGDEKEEIMTNVYANIITELLARNPELLEFINKVIENDRKKS